LEIDRIVVTDNDKCRWFEYLLCWSMCINRTIKYFSSWREFSGIFSLAGGFRVALPGGMTHVKQYYLKVRTESAETVFSDKLF